MTHDNDIGIRAVKEFLGEDSPGQRVQAGFNNENYLVLEDSEFETAVIHLAANKFILISLFCCEGFSDRARTPSSTCLKGETASSY